MAFAISMSILGSMMDVSQLFSGRTEFWETHYVSSDRRAEIFFAKSALHREHFVVYQIAKTFSPGG